MKLFMAAVALLALTGSASACGKWGYNDEGVGAWSGGCTGAKISAVDGTAARDAHNIISRVRLYYSPEMGCVKGLKARHGWDNPPNLVLIGSDQYPEAGALSISAGERITSVSWAANGGCMSYLSLRTNKGNEVTAGSAAAADVATFTAKGDQYLAAFTGATGNDASCSPLAALSFRWGFDDCEAPAAEPATPAPAAAEPEADLGEGEVVAPPPPPPCKKSFVCFGDNGGSAACAGLACDTKTGTVVCRSKLCAIHPMIGRRCVDEGASSCPVGAGDNLFAAKIAQAQQAKQAVKDAVAAAKGAKPTVGLKLVPVEIPVPEKPTVSGKPGLSTADVTLPTFKLTAGPKPAVMQDGLNLGHKKLAKLVAKATALASKVPSVSIEQGADKVLKVPVVTMPTIQAGGLKAKTVQVPVLDVSFPNKAREARAAAGDAAAAAAAATGVPAVPAVAAPSKLQDAAMDKLADVLEAAGPKIAQTLSKKVTAAEPLLVKLFGEPPETVPVNVVTNTGAPGGLVTLESQYDLLSRAQGEPRLFGTILRGFPQALAGAFQASAAQARAAGSGAAAAAAPAAPGRRLMGVAAHLQEAAAKAAAVGPAVETLSAVAQQVAQSKKALASELKRSAVDVKLPDNLAKSKAFSVRLVDVIDVADLAQCKWSVCGATETESEPEKVEGVVIEDSKEEEDVDVVVAKKSFLTSWRQKAAAAPQMLQLGQQLLGTDLQQPGGAMAATGVKA